MYNLCLCLGVESKRSGAAVDGKGFSKNGQTWDDGKGSGMENSLGLRTE